MFIKIFSCAVAVLFLVSLCSAVDNGFKWGDCGSKTGSITKLTVKDCDERRCPLKRNSSATISITFESNVPTKTLTAEVFGEVLGARKKFNLENPNACQDCGIDCPIESGRTYTYTNTVFVKPQYPRVTVDIIWKLNDENGETVVCGLIPAKIVSEHK